MITYTVFTAWVIFPPVFNIALVLFPTWEFLLLPEMAAGNKVTDTASGSFLNVDAYFEKHNAV